MMTALAADTGTTVFPDGSIREANERLLSTGYLKTIDPEVLSVVLLSHQVRLLQTAALAEAEGHRALLISVALDVAVLREELRTGGTDTALWSQTRQLLREL